MISLDDIAPVRQIGVVFHVLRDGDGLYLIDTGFVGAERALARSLRRRGWQELPIRGILLTHGHLDHVLHTRRMADRFGAWIAAPRGDAGHYRGQPVYSGWARVTGLLEAMGRPLLGFQPFTPDRWLEDGEEIAIGKGLRVVGLPGHTHGHCGFHCPARRLFFSGDLFASHGRWAHFPPRIFNSEPSLLPAALARTLALDLDGVLPNHGDGSPPEEHLRRLRALGRRMAR